MKHTRIMLLGTACGLALAVLPCTSVAGPNGQAKDAYTKGRYNDCIDILVQELRKKPDHQDNIELMDQSLNLYLGQLKSGAAAATASQDWDRAVANYDDTIRLQATLSGLPPVPKGRDKKSRENYSFVAQVPDVTTDRKAAADNAAEAHYQSATKYETAGNMRGAAIEYRTAQNFVRPFKDASDRYDACRKKGMVKVCVMPFEDKTGKNYGALGDNLTGKVLGAAMEAHPEFIEFITRENLDAILTEQNAGQTGIIDQTSAAKLGKIAGVQAFVFGKVLTIIEAFPAQTDKTSENTTSYDTKQGKVVQHAIYTVHRREGKVTVKAEMRIVDVATAQVKTQVPEDQVETDATCWITYQGDEDAIPYDAKSACTGGERALKIGQEMTIEGLDKIGVRFAQKLVSTF